MKFYPYSTIESENLKPLLISARVLGFISYLLFVLALLFAIYGIVSPTPLRNGLGSISIFSLYSAFIGISSILLLAFSGLCAAVVSCENKFTSTDK